MKQIEKTIERLVVLITGIIITACGNSYTSKNEVEYLPFQQREGGKWGLISQDGDILFSEMFDNEPTMAVNGRFMVKNKVGLWEIYTAEEEPRKVGGEYLQASMFYEDVTPVVLRVGLSVNGNFPFLTLGVTQVPSRSMKSAAFSEITIHTVPDPAAHR